MDPRLHYILDKNCKLLNSVVGQHDYLNLDATLIQRIGEVVSEVGQKLSSSQIRLAIVGGFSSGKSTLINALIGAPVLAAKVTPATICPTYIKRGQRTCLTVRGNWSGESHLSTSFPREPRLCFHRRRLSDIPMEDNGDCVWYAPVSANKQGMYNVRIMDGPVVLRELDVPVLGRLQPTQVFYNLLSGCASYSGEYYPISSDNLPKVFMKDSNCSKEVTLRCCDFSNVWWSVVSIPEDIVDLECSFDWDWFSKEGPKKIRKREPENLWDRIKMFFGKTSRFELLDVPVPDSPRMIYRIDNRDGRFGRIRVSLDLNSGTFQWTEADEPITRKFFFDEDDIQRASNFIGVLTATGSSRTQGADFAGIIEDITLEHPHVRVDESVIIIDTPGIAAESEHTKITISIVRDEADACLFLCPADQAGTFSDLRFVEENLMNVVGDIAFVITKSDKASDEEELEEIVESVRSKIEDRLGLAEPTIFTVSARDALNGDRRGQEQFSEFVQGVTRFAVRNRERILVRRLAQVERLVMEELIQKAKEMQDEYESQLKELKGYVIEDLEEFATREARIIDKKFMGSVELGEISDSLLDTLTEKLDQEIAKIQAAVNQIDSESALATFCDNHLEALYQYMYGEIGWSVVTEIQRIDNWLNEVAGELLSEFERSFEEKYPLKRIGGGIAAVEHNISLAWHELASTADAELQIVWGAESLSNTAKGWGTGAGALIGTFIAPGIGTVIGGIAGRILGSLFGPSLEETKRQVANNIARNVRDGFEKVVASELDTIIEEHVDKVRQGIRLALDQYLLTYKDTVQSLIEDHERKKKKVEEYIFETGTLVTELTYRLEELENLLA